MSGTKNNKELYKAAFSRLHASDAVIREEKKMINVKSKLRCSKLLAACICVALLVGATSGLTYAATDGTTANLVKAIKVYINGNEHDANIQKNDDGSYTVRLEKGDVFEMESEERDYEISMSDSADNYSSEITVNPDGSVSTAVKDGDVPVLNENSSAKVEEE